MQQGLVARWRSSAGVALLGMLLAAVGCSGNASVSGKVTLNGKPVTGGAVTFHGAGGKIESSWIDPDGNYSIAKAPVGAVKVTVMAADSTAAPKPRGPGEMPKHPGQAAAPPGGKPVAIPDKYKDPEKSGLTYTVSSGSQVIDIKMD